MSSSKKPKTSSRLSHCTRARGWLLLCTPMTMASAVYSCTVTVASQLQTGGSSQTRPGQAALVRSLLPYDPGCHLLILLYRDSVTRECSRALQETEETSRDSGLRMSSGKKFKKPPPLPLTLPANNEVLIETIVQQTAEACDV